MLIRPKRQFDNWTLNSNNCDWFKEHIHMHVKWQHIQLLTLFFLVFVYKKFTNCRVLMNCYFEALFEITFQQSFTSLCKWTSVRGGIFSSVLPKQHPCNPRKITMYPRLY